jgi:hypothetical protein
LHDQDYVVSQLEIGSPMRWGDVIVAVDYPPALQLSREIAV